MVDTQLPRRAAQRTGGPDRGDEAEIGDVQTLH
jgi:hypothetical protein